ncbi:MAG: hypothetical protein WD552_01765, partial [Candidatus Paceibacterota bacterium]
MLLIYHGNDIEKRKQATSKLREGLLQKRPEAEVFEFDADSFSAARLQELVESRGLFEAKYIVFLFHVLAEKELSEAVLEYVGLIKSTDHIFVLVEDVIEKKTLKKLEPHTEKLHHFAGAEGPSKFTPWSLSDAYGARDKKLAWLELQKALAAEELAEAVHGVLVWQTRLMLLAKTYDTAEAAGESGYPFKKAKGFSKNFSHAELEENFTRLVKSYHEAHRGKHDLFTA